MTEAEALKRFIPILGRISTPQERQYITRDILERIAGRMTSIMAVNHKQVGTLAWPGDPVRALEYENALNAAVDAGEFVSIIHRHDRRRLQIEELLAWPDCPAIAPDSPLTFWIGEPAPATDTAVHGSAPKPLQRGAAQDAAILHKLSELGFNPLALPKNEPGRPGTKSAVRSALSNNSLFIGAKVFDKAWERLSASGEIVIQR